MANFRRNPMVPKDPIQYWVLTVTTTDMHNVKRTVVLGVCANTDTVEKVLNEYFHESGLLFDVYNVIEDDELNNILKTKSKADVIHDWFAHFSNDTYDTMPVRKLDQLIP